MERENEIGRGLYAKLRLCDEDVNADTFEKDEINPEAKDAQPNQKSDRPDSLFMRKRDIIGEVNELVQFFNTNNKAVREASKTDNMVERDVAELTARNRQIQTEAAAIESKIAQAKDYADEIERRVDSLCEPLISRLRAKYEKKNALVDECDEQFDRCQQESNGSREKAQ